MNSTYEEIRFNDRMTKIREHFGEKTVVSRPEIMEYIAATGDKIPEKFWAIGRVARGMYDLHARLQAVEKAPVVVAVPEKTAVNHTHPQHRFDMEYLIPQVKDTYVEWGNFKTIQLLLKSKAFFTLYVTGDSGSGKNEMISQACAKLKRPLVRVAITRETKEEHLIGSKTLVDGSIVYEDGPVVWAAKNGAVLLVDEISAGDANELMCLQNVLEGEAFFVKSANMMVEPAEGFCIIATDNTKGRGSDSGRYIGTNILNDAFLERFEMTMEQGYPNEKIERSIIEKLMTKVELEDSKFTDRLVSWVQAIRKTYMEEGLEEHITTRRACHIVKTYKKIGKADTAVELCVNRFDETTKMAMMSLWEKLEHPTATEAPVDEDGEF